jgi:hypothetical protein
MLFGIIATSDTLISVSNETAAEAEVSNGSSSQPPRALRVDRRVRADLAEIFHSSLDLTSGALAER